MPIVIGLVPTLIILRLNFGANTDESEHVSINVTSQGRVAWRNDSGPSSKGTSGRGPNARPGNNTAPELSQIIFGSTPQTTTAGTITRILADAEKEIMDDISDGTDAKRLSLKLEPLKARSSSSVSESSEKAPDPK